MERNELKVEWRGLGIFVLLVASYIGVAIGASMVFPGSHAFPTVMRLSLSGIATVAMAVASEWLGCRQFSGGSSLGLKPSAKALRAFVIGAVSGILWVGVIAAVFWLFIPYHFERGELKGEQALTEITGFLWSNTGEELVFRGFLFLFLMRAIGLRLALFVIAVLFGLFHLPGLSGMAALKMVCTTAAASYLFAAIFLATGSVWGAIATHFLGNVVLHKVTGLSNGTALLKPVLHGTYPQSDPGFWVMLIVTLLFAGLVFRLGWCRRGGEKESAREVASASTTGPRNKPDREETKLLT